MSKFVVNVEDPKFLNDVLYDLKEEYKYSVSTTGILSYLLEDYLEKCRAGEVQGIKKDMIKYLKNKDKRISR